MTRLEDAFDEHAEAYDRHQEALRPIVDVLHIMLRTGLAKLPRDATILVAGAGTGSETRMLARRFPEWRFTLVDPSEAMLAIAERHAVAEGFAERCTFHVGFVSSLPGRSHDAATSILVSHFLTDANERQAYFEDIAARLEPGGPLFVADLCADRDHPSFDQAMNLWLRLRDDASAPTSTAMKPAPTAGDFRTLFGTKVAVHGPDEVEAILTRAGFEDLVLCCQALLIRGWLARRAAGLHAPRS